LNTDSEERLDNNIGGNQESEIQLAGSDLQDFVKIMDELDGLRSGNPSGASLDVLSGFDEGQLVRLFQLNTRMKAMKSNFKMQILLKKEESRLSNFYGGKGSAVALGTRQSQSPLHATTDLRSCSLLSKGSKNSRKSRNSGKGRSTRKLGATGLQF